MFKKHFVRFMIIASFILTQGILSAQEFPIAVGPDSTSGSGASWGGETGIVAILGDTLSQYDITAQLVCPPDSLIGDRISVGRTGIFPGGPVVEFDGTNYLLVWGEFSGDINGQFINTSGSLVGTYFTIGTNAPIEYEGGYNLFFGDTTYLVIFVKTDGYLYGQRVSKSGNLLGGQIQISNNHAKLISIAYDGTNYLVAWVEMDTGKDIYGQFVSKAGSLVGNNFLIDGGPYYSDMTTSLAFGGTRYLLAFHESPNSTGNDPRWTLFGCFITTSGTIEETITICDSTKFPFVPMVAFDGNNYLITWTQMSDMKLMGRFWTPQGVPMDEPFVISNPSSGKIPFGGCRFGGGWFLVVTSKVDSSFTDGDVYGTFISQTGVKEKPDTKLEITDLILLQNTPNPFKSATSIKYVLPRNGFVKLAIYDISGQLVHTLVKGKKCAGTYAVSWNGMDEQGNSVRSGIYFYCLEVNNLKSTRKMLLVK